MQAFIQRRWTGPRVTNFMKFVSQPPHWRVIALVLLVTFLVFGSNRTRLRLGLVLLAVVLSDQTSNMIKALCRRVRPKGMRTYKGFWDKLGLYSFPSSHAANNFAAAVIALHWAPVLGYPLLIWAIMVTVSRVILNSHYTLDVLAGALIGIIYGLAALQIQI